MLLSLVLLFCSLMSVGIWWFNYDVLLSLDYLPTVYVVDDLSVCFLFYCFCVFGLCFWCCCVNFFYFMCWYLLPHVLWFTSVLGASYVISDWCLNGLGWCFCGQLFRHILLWLLLSIFSCHMWLIFCYFWCFTSVFVYFVVVLVDFSEVDSLRVCFFYVWFYCFYSISGSALCLLINVGIICLQFSVSHWTWYISLCMLWSWKLFLWLMIY